MSVLVPDMKVFEYVQNGFMHAANNRTCDSLYVYSISAAMKNKGNNQIFEEAERWVKNLITLNCKSYAARYREKELGNLAPFYLPKNHMLEPFQLLKYLHCIEYNIEMKTIEQGYSEALECIRFTLTEQDKKDFETLQYFIRDLKDSIINNIPQYQNAKYSN